MSLMIFIWYDINGKLNIRGIQMIKNRKTTEDFANILKNSKNIILRGAPGTGKTYLAKKIATYLASDGVTEDYNSLTAEQKRQIGFVQFHPNYDYTDFVEGMRPIINDGNQMSFELRDGVFKQFVENARDNYEKSINPEEVAKKLSAWDAMEKLLDESKHNKTEYKIKRGNKFYVVDYDDDTIEIDVPANEKSSKVILKVDRLQKMIESGEDFKNIEDIRKFLGMKRSKQENSYYLVLRQKMTNNEISGEEIIEEIKEEKKNYVFIIDEINRGEISKIFGELFFAIDPGYRGKLGAVSTQYANMHDDPNEKFYIPNNVYIIGTMNDIDRSVDTFDFAMRRRFQFIEIKADDHVEMLNCLGVEEQEAINRMSSLNKAIESTEGLNANYQIGAAYFLKLKDMNYDYDQLWYDNLLPLLQEYVQGMYNEGKIIEGFRNAFDCKNANDRNVNNEDQG